VWDWLILSLTFYSVVMVPYNLAFNRSLSNDDITLLVIDSIVDLGPILRNFIWAEMFSHKRPSSNFGQKQL
jgi:hypothetical protein